DGFEGRSSLRTWVYRILINIAKTRGVQESRTVPVATLTADDGGPTVDPARFRGPDDPYPGHWKEFPQAWPAVDAEIERREVRSRSGDRTTLRRAPRRVRRLRPLPRPNPRHEGRPRRTAAGKPQRRRAWSAAHRLPGVARLSRRPLSVKRFPPSHTRYRHAGR